MEKLTKRQSDILRFIRERGTVKNQEIKEFLEVNFGELSRITVVRDLDELLNKGLIKKQVESSRTLLSTETTLPILSISLQLVNGFPYL